jgi:hypothetical protein
VRAAIDDAGRHTIVSAVRFQPPTPTPLPTTAAPSPAPPVPTATARPQSEPSDEGGRSGEGTVEPTSDDDDEGQPQSTEGDEEEEDQEKIEFEGVVESIGGSLWVIDGRSVRVDGGTEIHDDPGVGDTVKVVAFSQPDGSWWAEKIELED